MNSAYQEIPRLLYEDSICNYLHNMVRFGIECYNDLNEKEEEQLSQLIIDSCGTDALDILDLDDDDLPINVNSKDKILHRVYRKFQNNIDRLFLEIIDNNKDESNRFNGQVGEIEWRL